MPYERKYLPISAKHFPVLVKNHVKYCMLLNHVGIINESEEKAVRFYHGILGFEKAREFVVPTKLSEQLFSVSREIKVLVFERDGIKLEVFICHECRQRFPDYSHIGFLLDDFHSIKEKAQQMGVLIVGITDEKTVYFLKDFSGNLIEIKPK
jgi:methylmalonyl-CoA/ethylmalonyl-CoA epimerase